MSSAPDSVGSRDVDQRVEVVDHGHSVPSPRSTAPPWLTGYLTDYWNAHPEDTPAPAGVVVLHALQGPPGTSTPYIDLSLDPGQVAAWGPSRSVRDHLLLLRERWDATVSPVITVVRVVLGLALDPELGRLLLGTGAIESVVRLWTPRPREGREPTLLPWDMLSDRGRSEAEEQPLLAAALGAPSEWNGGKRIALPGHATAIAFGPGGDRLAVLCGSEIYRVTRQGAVERLGEAPPNTHGVGWARSGVVTLSVEPDGNVKLQDVTSGNVLLTHTGIQEAALSGDGSTLWMVQASGVTVLRVGEPSPAVVEDAAERVVAVDHDGRLALTELAGRHAVVSRDSSAPMPEGSGFPLPPSEGLTHPAAVGRVAGRPGRARPAGRGGVLVDLLPETPVARIATGPGPVTALASGPGGLLAVASGKGLGVWSLGTAPAVEVRPQYAPDRAGGPQDLLDTDRDARALAALIASGDLTPPMAVGLFGAWGSGKSFLLQRIRHFLKDADDSFTKAPDEEGYLSHVTVVSFNAWHYAETNLWASLVNEVLRAIRKDCSSTWEADEKVRAAEQALADARLEVWRRRRNALLAVAAAAVVVLLALVLWRTGFVRWLWALGVVTVVLSVADATRKTAGWLKDVGPLFTAIAGVWSASRRLAVARLDAALARRNPRDEVREAEELVGTIRRLVEEPEYRDLLGLVTRTRERFESLDEAVRTDRKKRAERAAAVHGVEPAEEPAELLPLERVVVMIDDLDRCPPEKVVSVLEAVHLLFDFELFVVLLAVDTRWLAQSLRIRYRQLLGGSKAASPSDYLEKIIQVPLQVLPLDDAMVRRMLAGLTGVFAPTAGQAGSAPAEHVTEEPSTPLDDRAQREATQLRQQRSLAQVLQITPADAEAMSAVAPLIGTSPRTVKRFVNTYRLLKARATDLTSFSERHEGVADHEIVAFLLAVVTGRADIAVPLLTTLTDGRSQATVRSVLEETLPSADDAASPAPPDPLIAWLDVHPALGGASAARCTAWANEVRRFTFLPSQG